jgi:type IV secretory pathway TrbD component
MADSQWVVDTPAGFEVPVYRAALRPKLMLGAPTDFTALMLGAAGFGFLWRLWPLLPLVVILHSFAIWGTRQDAKWFEKALQVLKYKRYYKA